VSDVHVVGAGGVGTLRALRRASVAEALSYLALLVATAVKETGGTEVGVSILGPIHGVLYLVFAALVLANKAPLEWSWIRAIMALFIGALPFGGLWLDRRWLAPYDTERDPEVAPS